MNLRDLEYLIAVAETRHFGHAAERCFVSQPTLSGQIKKLEQELGVELFERSNRRVSITPAGEEVLQHARRIMEQRDAIKQLAMAYQDPVAGPLRLGAIPTISPYLMPLILQPLQQKYPQMRLFLSEEQTEVLLQRLKNYEIDAAIVATEHPELDFEVVPLFEEPFWLAYPLNDPLYFKEQISQQDLSEINLLLLAEGHCLADQAMQVCHRHDRGSQEDMANLRASSLETLLQLVGAGYGSTLVPALAMTGAWTSGRGIATSKLEVNSAYRRVSLLYRASFPRRAALDALVGTIVDNLPNTVKTLKTK